MAELSPTESSWMMQACAQWQVASFAL